MADWLCKFMNRMLLLLDNFFKAKWFFYLPLVRVNTLNWTKNYYATNSGFTFKLYLPFKIKIMQHIIIRMPSLMQIIL